MIALVAHLLLPTRHYFITEPRKRRMALMRNNFGGTSAVVPPPAASYLVMEDGVSKFTLEDGSGSLLLE